jgi:hypothetical protein
MLANEAETMASTGAIAPALEEERLEELLKLTAGADSVELKLTVPESDQYATAQALVKLRPVVPEQVPKRLRKSPAFVVEVDAVPGSFVCSGTLKAKVDNAEVRNIAFGRTSLESLLSDEQRKLFAEHAPEGIALDDLAVLGPILVLKLKFQPEGYAGQMVLEVWSYPDSSRVLELSTKCRPREAFQVAAETRVFLSKRGVDLAGDQETKTKKALEFFAQRLGGTS